MGLRNGRSQRLMLGGVTDSIDGTEAPEGSLTAAINAIPEASTGKMWTARPAAISITQFAGFTTPGFISALLVVGDVAYGMIASGLHAGKDQPFAYSLSGNNFLAISGITAANSPTSPPSSGQDWTPPILCQVGQRVIVTHPGFSGGTIKFGWFDISGFSDDTHTGATHGTTTIDGLSGDVLAAGWQPGMAITSSGGDLAAGTTIVSIATDGLSVVITPAATGSNAGDTFTVTGGTPTNPQWAAGDTNLFPLPSQPVSVAQFNGRAYFACGVNGVPFSDSLLPCNRSNDDQALNFGNGLAVTALGPLPLSSPITGGIIQSIIAFQGVGVMQQITGDPATPGGSNLAVNALDVATGTLSPLSITPTEQGLIFMSPVGLREINFSAQVSPPLGHDGEGVAVPFIDAEFPSRVCVAASASVIRVTTQNSGISGQPNQEYWFHLNRKLWSGPHTCACDQVQLWGVTFLAVLRGVNAQLFQSHVLITTGSSYVENGSTLTYSLETSLSPDSGDSAMQSILQSTIFASYPSAPTILVTDDSGNVLDTVLLPFSSAGTIWGSFTWGQANWTAALVNPTIPKQRPIQWHNWLIFKQAQLSISGVSGPGLKIGLLEVWMTSNRYMIGDLGTPPPVPVPPPPPVIPNEFTTNVSNTDGPDVLG